MAFWVTHLYVADVLMEKFATLERRAFCAGNIAPDCNVENEDWSAFTPPREMTHFMSGRDKDFDGCERFYSEHIKRKSFLSNAEKSFLFGYYAHLVTDVVYQNHVRDDARVKNVWRRIMSDPDLRERAAGLAAAQTVAIGTPLPGLDIAPLQEALAETGVIIHFDDAWVPEGEEVHACAPEGHI